MGSGASSSGHKVIGGLFGLETLPNAGQGAGVPFFDARTIYFLNARCAICAELLALRPRTAWAPSYLCGAVLDPFRKLGIPVRYYDDGPNFKNETRNWVENVQSGDVVLAIHYFGFPNATFPADALTRCGAEIIEDASQGLFVKQHYPGSVCIVYSPRKFLGVPDGGVMVSSRRNFRPPLLESPPVEWWTKALAAAQMRREFDLLGGENRWFRLFREVEETFPLGPYRSSDLTRVVIETTDYAFVKKARRANYTTLAERLRKFALFPVLDEETVPLGFPVCVDATRRDTVLECLYKQEIYPPVHWRIDGIVPAEHKASHLLSHRILTLVCDQRYTTSDMSRQADAFLAAVADARSGDL